MTNWTQERIQRTLEIWQPEYDKIGVKLDENDAREILDTLTGFFEILHRWDIESKKKMSVKPKIIEEKIVLKENDCNGEKKLVDIEELASILSVPKSWIYQRTRFGQKEIPYIKVGKYLRFDPDEVISFFKEKNAKEAD